MPYLGSYALERWHGERSSNIEALQQAHAQLGEVTGPGRPLELGRPIAHAYIVRVVAEFQGFTRDLHDLAAEVIARLSEAASAYLPLLVTSMTDGRRIDAGNADLASLSRDFKRIGIVGLSDRLAEVDGRWRTPKTKHYRGDSAYYSDLIDLRNCLAHGNQGQLLQLRSRGVYDTLTWARGRLAGLDRFATALDRVVWDHLGSTFGTAPW